jgi:hypothetical protein
MKFALIAGAASLMAAPAMAGPYVNVETNAGYLGNEYQGATTETHVGYEGDLGERSGWYVQAGPAFVSPDGEDTTTELSGKVGINVGVTERLSAYGEIAAITTEEMDFDADLNVGAKIGVKFAF